MMATMTTTTSEASSLLQFLLDPSTRGSIPASPAVPQVYSSILPPVTASSSPNSQLASEDRPWVCEKCSFPFKYKNNLLEHMRFYHMKGSVPCSKCNKVFPTSRDLRIHRKEHAVGEGRCPHCRCTFPGSHNTPELYHEMYKLHLPECRRCPAKMSLQMGNTKSTANSGNCENFIWCCLACGQSFSDLADYETHDCQAQEDADYSMEDSNFDNLGCAKDTVSSHQLNADFGSAPLGQSNPTTSTSKIDFNFLCIICGVNFENEEKLNSHLYESHQSCDQDPIKKNEKSLPACSEIKPVYTCMHCEQDFPEKCDLENHEILCAPKMNQTTNVKEVVIKKEPNEDACEDLDSGVIVCWVCKYCKDSFPSKSDMVNHKKVCTCKKGSTIPAPGLENSTVGSPVTAASSESSNQTTRFTCEHCTALFTDGSELEVHIQQCKHVSTEPESSDVIVQWICKYCKVAFPSQDTMKEHKEVCALEHGLGKHFQRKAVLIKWLCKYCKNDFESREDMQVHKKSCVLRNKDISVTSSAESDKSENVSPAKRRCFESTENGVMLSSSNRCFIKDVSVFGSKRANSNTGNVTFVDAPCNDGEGAEEELIIHDYSCELLSSVDKTDPATCTRPDDNNNSTINSLAEEEFLIKWVCKYCKQAFDNRELMYAHKNVCDRKKKDVLARNSECNSCPETSEINAEVVPKENALTVESTGVDPTVVGELTNHDEKLNNTKHGIKLKIKLKHSCNICGKKFALRRLMRTHKLETHMVKCSKCGRYLKSNAVLWKHTRLCRVLKASPECHKMKVYSCKVCYRVFREKYKFRLHKGSCRPLRIEEKLNVLLGEGFLLRIKCSKCGVFVGNDIFSDHSCEKTINVEVFLDCQCCGLSCFSKISDFYAHHLLCSDSTDYCPPSKINVRLLCKMCLRQFDTIFFYYRHLLANISCTGMTLFTEATDSGASDDESSDWTCSFCQLIVSSLIPSNVHNVSCKARVCRKCGFCAKSPSFLPAHNCGEGLQKLAAAKVVLHRLPSSLCQEKSNFEPPQPPDVVPADELPVTLVEPSVALPVTPVQRCVICYKKCRFAGAGLPPIGQLECFRCREKLHRKELKKKGEIFYSRLVFDEDSKPIGRAEEQYFPAYLDPSKRLKLSRANKVTKAKQEMLQFSKVGASSQERTSQESLPEVEMYYQSAQTLASTKNTRNNSSPSSDKIVSRCSHCKRGFATREELQKHVQLSKTCLHAESTKQKSRGESQMSHLINKSGIINFADFLANTPNSATFCQGSSNNLCESHRTSSSCSDTVTSTNSCFNSQNSFQSSSENSRSDCTFLSGGSSGNQQAADPAQTLSREVSNQSFLCLESVDKVMSSRNVVNRVPICPTLQCDGWILKSDRHTEATGIEKVKLICGACYRSFSDETLFTEHASVVHRRPSNSIVKLNVMNHIPSGMLNKLSW